MINYFELRASDMTASGDDPYAAVNAELFIGPMVRIFSISSQCSTEISLFCTCFSSADWCHTQHTALWDAALASGNLLSVQSPVCLSFSHSVPSSFVHDINPDRRTSMLLKLQTVFAYPATRIGSRC